MSGMPVEQAALRRLPRPSLWNVQTRYGLLFLAVLGWAVWEADVWGRTLINPGGRTQVVAFLDASVHPMLAPDMLVLALHSSLITLSYAVCGTVLSLLLGIVGSVCSSEVWWQLVLPERGAGDGRMRRYQGPWLAIRGLLALPRAIHEAIWALFFVQVIGLNPLTAVLGIAIPFGAITAKVFAEFLDEAPRGPLLALQHSGVSPLKALFYTVVPQAFPDLLSYAFYRFECAIRAAAVMGIIGAGGLGYQILLSLQALRYQEMWVFLYALIVLCALTDGWSSVLRRRLNLPSRVELNAGRPTGRAPMVQIGRDPVAVGSLIGGVLLTCFSFWFLHADLARLFEPRTGVLLAHVIRDSFPPHVSKALLATLWSLAGQTLSMSILAITFAGLSGLMLSFPAAHTFALAQGLREDRSLSVRALIGWPIFVLARALLLIVRAVSAPVWALIFLFVLFPGILPGAIGLGLYNLGVVGRLMAEVTENQDNRPLRALQAQGASGPAIFLYGVLPQTLPRCLAYVLYRWEVCIRETVIVGLVGAGGLGLLLTEQLSSFDYRSVVTTLLCFLALTFVVDIGSGIVRRRLR